MQTNVTYNSNTQSERMLAKFEEISTKGNIESVEPISTSIKVKCKCGCTMVQHFAVKSSDSHYKRYFVELCDKHSLSADELNPNP